MPVGAAHSTRTLSERSTKPPARNTSPPVTKKKLCAQGLNNGISPSVPPGFEVAASRDSIGAVRDRQADNTIGDTVKHEDGGTKDKINESWPLLGVAGEPPLPSRLSPPPAPPPGLEGPHRREQREDKDRYSMKLAKLPHKKASKTHTAGDSKRPSSSQRLVPLKPTPEYLSIDETVTDVDDASMATNSSGSGIFAEIRQALGYDREKFREFQTLSGWYRKGGVSIGQYNSQCEDLFGGHWFVIGPQLAKIMPPGQSKENLIAYFTPQISDRGGAGVGVQRSHKKKTKKHKPKQDEEAWVTVGAVAGRQPSASGKRKQRQAAFSEEEYPSLATAAKLPPQSKPPLHNPWNVQVRT